MRTDEGRRGDRMIDMKGSAGKLKRVVPFFLYLTLWFVVFYLLKKRPVDHYYYPVMDLDRKIPLVRAFSVPYLLWFPWLVFIYFYTAWTDAALYGRISRMAMELSGTDCRISLDFSSGIRTSAPLRSINAIIHTPLILWFFRRQRGYP